MIDRERVTCDVGNPLGVIPGDVVGIYDAGRPHPEIVKSISSETCHGVVLQAGEQNDAVGVRLFNSGTVSANVNVTAAMNPGDLLTVDGGTGTFIATAVLASSNAMYVGTEALTDTGIRRLEVLVFRMTA